MNQSFITLGFGFLLGLKHAFEADHMIAVTTMVTEHKNPLRAALVGTFWGVGHTTTLFLAGILVLLLNITIPERLSLTLELFVACMLVLLGIRTIRSTHQTLHEHPHEHHGATHDHMHVTHHHNHQHRRSLIIGAVHGMAGSGALMILVLSTIHSLVEGLYYILVFGAGSIMGMTLMSFLVGLPFIFSVNKFNKAERYIKLIAGSASIVFGIYMGYIILFVDKLLPV